MGFFKWIFWKNYEKYQKLSYKSMGLINISNLNFKSNINFINILVGKIWSLSVLRPFKHFSTVWNFHAESK